MALSANFNKATRQLPKLKSLLNKYRQVRTMQAGLLGLSELSSRVTDIHSFYNALDSVISSLFTTDCFRIVLANENEQLHLAYVNNNTEADLIATLDKEHWLKSITALVFNSEESLHCSAAERMALIQTGQITDHSSICIDWLGVPLKRGQQIIGVITLQSFDEKSYFDDRDCQLLAFIADHLVTAIDRVSSRELLEKNIQDRTRKLTKINHELQREIAERQKAERIHKVLLSISEITASSNDLPSFYQALHQQIKCLLPADNFYITLLSADNNELECPYFVDQHHELPSVRPLGRGLIEKVMQIGLPMLICKQEQLTLTEHGHINVEPFNFPVNNMAKSWLSAPLKEQNKIVGVLVVQNYQHDDAYQQSDMELMRFVAHHMAIAITRKRNQLQNIENKDALENTVKERTHALEIANSKLRMQIEERKKAEQQLHHDAHHDALTQLPNRAMFSERLNYSLSHFKRHPNQRFAVLFIDLDRFKMINDTLGHLTGDNFLIEIAQRLADCVRDNDLLARLGGDEFVILLDAFQSQDDIEEIATRIIERVSQPFHLDGNTLYSNASIGIAMFNQQYKNANDILRDADAAMYQAKDLGRGRYVFFDESMHQQLMASLTLEQELRAAIEKQQFELHYQAITSLDNEVVIGFEAFLRWAHPSKGLLSPCHFLCLAEETGLILVIESWVIKQVSAQLNFWEQQGEHPSAFIAVNLSGRQLTQGQQLDKLIATISHYGIEPHRLILEFNEDAFCHHTELALSGLNKLKVFGVRLALDNYGTGFSSFNFLHSYPFEFIKLDRSFIDTLADNGKNLLLIKALSSLGQQFGYRVVAEGIESQEMLNKLIAVGCEYGQGYHLGRPEKLISTLPDNFIIEELA